MKSTEGGFTYPLTLILFLLFLLLFSVKVEQLLGERKMAHETQTIFQQEYYYLNSIKKIEKLYQSYSTLPIKGQFTYANGRMDYQAETPIGSTQKVNFTLQLTSGELVRGKGTFDITKKKLSRWEEPKK
jgi:hypothetical protein